MATTQPSPARRLGQAAIFLALAAATASKDRPS